MSETSVRGSQQLKTWLLERHVDNSHSCLDIGAFNGIHLLPLATRVRHISGVDLDAKAVADLQQQVHERRWSHVDVLLADACQLPFKSDTFDRVYSFSTLVLVPDADAFVKEAWRVLKPGGVALIDVAGALNPAAAHWRRWYRKHGQSIYPLTWSQIENLITRHGFRLCEQHASGLLDFWTCLPLLWRCRFLEVWLHRRDDETRSVDYRLSQMFPALANRWFLVLEKPF